MTVAYMVEMESDDSKSLEEIKEILLRGEKDGWFTRQQVHGFITIDKTEIHSKDESGPLLRACERQGNAYVRSSPDGTKNDNLLSLPGGPNYSSLDEIIDRYTKG